MTAWMKIQTRMVAACMGFLASCSTSEMIQQVSITEGTGMTFRDESYTPRPFDELNGFFEKGQLPGDTILWKDDMKDVGTPEIVIDKGKQMGYFFRGNKLMAYFPVSTGKYSVSTPEGDFTITFKNAEHKSCYGKLISLETGKVTNKDFDIRKQTVPEGEKFIPAEMPFFMRIKDTVGIHQGYLPGYPASHGCIRVPSNVAPQLFNATPMGTRVIIRSKLPKNYFKDREQKAASPTEPLQKSEPVDQVPMPAPGSNAQTKEPAPESLSTSPPSAPTPETGQNAQMKNHDPANSTTSPSSVPTTETPEAAPNTPAKESVSASAIVPSPPGAIQETSKDVPSDPDQTSKLPSD